MQYDDSAEKIIKYNPRYRDIVEDFLLQAVLEGSAGTYKKEKFDLGQLDEQSSLWLAVVNNEVASISYAERSFITGTPESIRKCRYHILKKYRHGRYGFKLMKHQLDWAKANGFKHYYWTHNVEDVAINKLFQHKKKYLGGDNSWFRDEDYKKMKLETDFVFHDSPKSDMIQFVYSYYIDPTYEWKPQKAVIWHQHTGQLEDVKNVL